MRGVFTGLFNGLGDCFRYLGLAVLVLVCTITGAEFKEEHTKERLRHG